MDSNLKDFKQKKFQIGSKNLILNDFGTSSLNGHRKIWITTWGYLKQF